MFSSGAPGEEDLKNNDINADELSTKLYQRRIWNLFYMWSTTSNNHHREGN